MFWDTVLYCIIGIANYSILPCIQCTAMYREAILFLVNYTVKFYLKIIKVATADSQVKCELNKRQKMEECSDIA